MKDIKFEMYIPNYRIGFIVNGNEYTHGAFGIVVIKLSDKYNIKLLDKEELINEKI